MLCIKYSMRYIEKHDMTGDTQTFIWSHTGTRTSKLQGQVTRWQATWQILWNIVGIPVPEPIWTFSDKLSNQYRWLLGPPSRCSCSFRFRSPSWAASLLLPVAHLDGGPKNITILLKRNEAITRSMTYRTSQVMCTLFALCYVLLR